MSRRKAPALPFKKVTIEWHDAASLNNGQWVTADDVRRELTNREPTTSTGFLLHECPDWIVYACDVDSATYFAGAHVLPRGCVVSIKELK